MRPLRSVLSAACALALAGAGASVARALEQPSPDVAAILQEFNKRVADYMKIHKTAEAQMHRLKPTDSAETIVRHERNLALRIREARPDAAAGNIFTPAITGEFRRLIGISLKGPDAALIRESLRHAEPPPTQPLPVNGTYPAGLPLQSTPPSLLLNLPDLPKGLEYRVVGQNLVLLDPEANLIVDCLSGAIP